MEKIKILKHNERLTKKSLSKILKKLNVSVEDLDKDEYFWLMLASGAFQFKGDITYDFIQDKICGEEMENEDGHWFHLFQKDSGYKCRIILDRKDGLHAYYNNKLLLTTDDFNDILKLKSEWINKQNLK